MGRRQLRTLIRGVFHFDPDFDAMPWHKERELIEGVTWWMSGREEWPSIWDILAEPEGGSTTSERLSSFGATVRKATA